MIRLEQLTKRYHRSVAVDDVTLTTRPGQVTGLLGPNGSGKSTTFRLVLGLDRPTAGTATFAGSAYRHLASPLRTVGAVLDARAVHPDRRALHHLAWLARAGRLPPQRVEEVLDQVGLADVGERRVGTYSLGMRQRLAIAAALLGDPEVLLLDEPTNGLDPDGVRWVRDLARRTAADGRTVLVASHALAEMELIVDRAVVLRHGRVVSDTTMGQLRADRRSLDDLYAATAPARR